MYKFLAICFFAIFVKGITAQTLTEEQIDHIESIFYKFGTECHEEFPIKQQEAEKYVNVEFPIANVDTGCFASCVLKKAGFFDQQGKLSETSALENIKYVAKDDDQFETAVKILHDCTRVNDEPSDSQGCKRAISAYNCIMEQSSKYGVI